MSKNTPLQQHCDEIFTRADGVASTFPSRCLNTGRPIRHLPLTNDAPDQMMEHGLGPVGRADRHPRRNPLDRQGRFAPQPGGNSLKKSPLDLQPLTTIQ